MRRTCEGLRRELEIDRRRGFRFRACESSHRQRAVCHVSPIAFVVVSSLWHSAGCRQSRSRPARASVGGRGGSSSPSLRCLFPFFLFLITLWVASRVCTDVSRASREHRTRRALSARRLDSSCPGGRVGVGCRVWGRGVGGKGSAARPDGG